MLGVFAEFETNLRRERQLEGIAKAKAEGVYKGRKPSISREKIANLEKKGWGRPRLRSGSKLVGHRSTDCYLAGTLNSGCCLGTHTPPGKLP